GSKRPTQQTESVLPGPAGYEPAGLICCYRFLCACHPTSSSLAAHGRGRLEPCRSVFSICSASALVRPVPTLLDRCARPGASSRRWIATIYSPVRHVFDQNCSARWEQQDMATAVTTPCSGAWRARIRKRLTLPKLRCAPTRSGEPVTCGLTARTRSPSTRRTI